MLVLSSFVEGKKIIAIAKNGVYSLHSEKLAIDLDKPLNYNAIKVYVPTLEDAAKLIAEAVTIFVYIMKKQDRKTNENLVKLKLSG